MDENQDVSSEEALVADVDVASPDGEIETVKETPQKDSVSLEELGDIMGTQYKDKETALKSVKDTKNFVGKAGQAPKETPEVAKPEGDFISKSEFETEMFYKGNDEFTTNRELIDALALKNSQTPQEVVVSESYKTIADKVKGYDESQNVKSVLETNPKLGQVRDKLGEAKDSMKESMKSNRAGDVTGATQYQQNAENKVVEAVLDSIE